MNAHMLNESGVIVNTIVVDALDVFPDLVDSSIGGSIGDRVVNGAVVKNSVEIVPESVPKLNARLVLITAGYWDDVVAFVNEQGPIAVAFLEDAQTVRRDNQLVNAWAAARGKTNELDALFIAADKLKVDQL